MGNPHSRVRRVDMLSARARGPHGVDPDIVGLDFNVDVLGFRQHRNGCRRSVNATPRFGFRNPLHAVHPGLELEPREHAFAAHRGNNFLVTAGFALARRQDFHLPPPRRSIALVHPEQIASKQRRLRTTCTGSDLDDSAALVSGILGQQHDLDCLFKLFDPVPDYLEIRFSQLAHFAIG